MATKQVQGNINVSENLTINDNIPLIVVESIDNINLETVYDGTVFFVKATEEFLIKQEGELNPYFPLNKLNLGFVEDREWIAEEESDALYKYISEEEYTNLNSKDFIALFQLYRARNIITLCKLEGTSTQGIKSRSFISDSFYKDESFPKSLFKIQITLTKETNENEVIYKISKTEEEFKPDTLQHFKKVVEGEQVDTQFNAYDIVYCTKGTVILESGSESSKPTGWYLVTDPTELKEDDKIIIVCNDHNVALSTQQNKNNRGETSVVIENNVITAVSPDVEQFILKSKYEDKNTQNTEQKITEDNQPLQADESSSPEAQNDDIIFSLYASNGTTGYLFNASSSNNYLKTQDKKTIYSNFSIKIDESGLADLIITANSVNCKYIRHNSQNNIFSCYKSGQDKVSIYKYVQGAGDIITFDNTFITKDSDGNVKTLENKKEIAYLNEENNKLYEYQEGQLVEISKVLELGNTSDTAYRGDYGTGNYNNIQNILNNNTSFKGNKIFNNDVTFKSDTYFNSQTEFNSDLKINSGKFFVNNIRTNPYSNLVIGNNPNGDNEQSESYIFIGDDNNIQINSSNGNNDSSNLSISGSDINWTTTKNLNLSADKELRLQYNDPYNNDADIKLYPDNYFGSGKAYYKGIEIATVKDVDNTNLVEMTWAELKALRDNSQLIPGRFYRITDYVTTTSQENTRSAGHQFDIIVRADDERTLNENATAAVHEGDQYFQEVTNHTKLASANWKEGITLSSITEKYKISDDQEAYLTPMAEDKAFTEMLTITNKDGIEVPCLLNPDPEGNGQDDYLVYCGTYEWKKATNTLLTVYYTITEDKSQEYKGQCSSHADDIFVEIAYKDIGGVSTPVLYKEDLGFYLSDNSSVDYGDEFRYLDDYTVDGVKYNRWVKYDDSTTGYYQILTNIIVVNNQFTVSPEEFRSAVHEITVIYDKWQECDSTGEPNPEHYYILTNNLVDAEWTVLNTSVKTLANLSAWKIKYCLDNDTDTFTWALDGQAIINLNSFGSNGKLLTRQQSLDGRNPSGVYSEYQYAWGTLEDVDNGDSTNFIYSKNATLIGGETVYNSSQGELQNAEVVEGKGVIYYMKDEWNNEAPYDFKNIQFKRYKITECEKSPSLVGKYLGIKHSQDYTFDIDHFIWCYTFTWINQTSAVQDCSIIGETLTNDERQYEGVFNNKLTECSTYATNHPKASENFGIALNNIVMQSTYSYQGGVFYGMRGNIFGTNCYDITLGDSCQNNTFGSNCSGNTFGNSCYSNIFGNDCYCNIFGNGCTYNIFGNECKYNIFGNGCTYNIFGNDCVSNTFGNNFSSNTFGSSCYDNAFGNDCVSNTFGNGCGSNIFGNDCYTNTFGNSSIYIVFGTRSGSTNTPANYYKYNILDNGCSYLCLNADGAASWTNELQNIHIHSGVKGTESSYKNITVERNLSYSITILAPGSREIILDEE